MEDINLNNLPQTLKNMEKSSSSPPPPISFSSLPNDISLNILARISRMHRPMLSLVSKNFQSLLASRELHVTRTLLGKTENYMYLCLKFKEYSEPRWFALALTLKQHKLMPLPSSGCEHPESPSVVSIGSEIYLIGGFVNKKRSRKVFFLDCEINEWYTLPKMLIRRGNSAVEVIDGKIYVIGGCDENEHWGEVYDPKTQTWEQLPTLDLTVQKSVVRDKLVMGGKVYDMNGKLLKDICLVEIENNVMCQISVSKGKLIWCDAYEDMGWRSVTELERLSYKNLVSVANSWGGRKVIVWWKIVEPSCVNGWETKLWCAEISLERQGVEELRGVVEWSKSVVTLDDIRTRFDFFLHSAIITH